MAPPIVKRVIKDASRGDLRDSLDLQAGMGLAENNRSELEQLLRGEASLKAMSGQPIKADVELVNGEETPEQSEKLDRLWKMSYGLAKGSAKDLTPDEHMNVAKRIYDDMKVDTDKYLGQFGEALKLPGVVGLPTPETVLPTQEQQQAIRQGKLWHKTPKQAQEEVLVGHPEVWKEHFMGGGALPPEVQAEIDKKQALGMYGAERPNEDIVDQVLHKFTAAGNAVSAGVGGAMNYLRDKGAGAKLGKTGVAGIDPKVAAQVLAGDFNWKDALANYTMGRTGQSGILGAAANNAARAYEESPAQTEHSGAYAWQRAQDDYKAQADARAAELGNMETGDELSSTAPMNAQVSDAIYKSQRKEDPILGYAIDNPELAGAGVAAIADPLNYLPVGKAVRGATKLAGQVGRKIPGVRGALDVGQAIREGFELTPAMTRMGQATGEIGKKAEDLNALAEMARTQGQVVGEGGAHAIREGALQIKKLVPDERERHLLGLALNGKFPAELLPTEKLKDAYRVGKQLASETHAPLRASTGVAQRLVEGDKGLEVLGPQVRKDYMPQKYALSDDVPLVEEESSGLKSLSTDASFRREEKRDDWIRDPVEAWSREAGQMEKQTGAAHELKFLKKNFEEQGAIIDLPTDPKQHTALLKHLSDRDDIPWVSLKDYRPDRGTASRFLKVTGKAGDRYAEFNKAMPQPVADHIYDVLKAGDSPEEVNKILGSVNKGLVAPIMKLQRTAALMFSPAFYVKSAVSNLANMFLAKGALVKPTQEAVALGSALANMWGKKEFGKGIEIAGAAGNKIDVGEAYRRAKEIGMLGQGDLATGLEGVGQSTVGAAGKAGALPRALNKALDPITKPGRKIAQATDDFSRFSIFLSKLTDLSDLSVARASKYVDETMGDYRRIGKFDQSIKQHMLFYTFARKASTAGVRHMIDRPGRIAQLGHYRDYQNDVAGRAVPVGDAGIPADEGGASRAPLEDQPKELQEKIRRGEGIDPIRDKYTVQHKEDMADASFGWLRTVEELLGSGNRSRPSNIADLLGAIPKATLDVVRNTQDTGKILKKLPQDLVGRPVRELGVAWDYLREKYGLPAEMSDLTLEQILGLDTKNGLPEEAKDEGLGYKLGNQYYLPGHRTTPGTSNKLVGPAYKAKAQDQATALKKAKRAASE